MRSSSFLYFHPFHFVILIFILCLVISAEREALNGEMLRRIKETKLTLLAMTQDTLHPTTKRTQQENEQVRLQFFFLSFLSLQLL
jgi:integral membrane sensor domain MASE1